MIILSKGRQKDKYHNVTYTWNLKHGASEPVYKTETDAQTQRTEEWLPGRRQGRGRERPDGAGTEAELLWRQ